jgi:alanyl-tRNA synthetase
MQTKNKMVKIKVDLEHREKLKRLHSATHVVNYCAREILGSHIWQNGSNVKEEFATLDITHYQNLSTKELSKIEKLANQLVFQNKKVKIEEMDRAKAERQYGYILYQGGAVPMKTLRLVKIEDDDVEACGGLHVANTGDIGLIKITESSKIQDGVVRLKYVVHEYALDVIDQKEKILRDIANIFSVEEKDLVNVSTKFFKEAKDQRKENDKLKDLLKNNYIKQSKDKSVNNLQLESDFDMKFIMDLFEEILDENESFKLESPKFILATQDFTIKSYKKEIKKKGFNLYIK